MISWTGLAPVSWGVAVCGAAAVLWAATAPAVRVPEPVFAAVPQQAVRARPPYRTDSLAEAVVARDLFRVARIEPAAPYDPETSHEQSAMPYDELPKPYLRLVGFIEAEEPTALVEGIPETAGTRVVREGDRIAGLLIKRIREGRVEVVGMDTVWVLTVRESWN